MKDLQLEADTEGTVEFIPGSMVPSHPFKRENGALVLTIYNQEGHLQNLHVHETQGNEMFGVWLRRFDRYSGKYATDAT